ncbi:4-phosphoerythronate dehydrogenase PdxB [Motiliproteus sp. SC1-56]|uniref:4-phosphoerythronate dehydrogenase PdxB n=1 Tax=Motiliproteus sp. SC1-56 TaxID=2799565 RepID=UPI001A8F3DC2|nr:4-phosphoerythronate dehydrogenase PdxB [Motiliproteus sp. SC1-56]
MLILADENIPLVRPFFEGLGRVEVVDGRHLAPERAQQADVLLVRSVTQVDRRLLENGRVGFVASATIGTDHLDLDYLADAGIGVANAPGCNAEAVVDYVISALLNLAAAEQVALASRTLGIVGLGNVGGRLRARLQALGLEVLCCDPPRAEREGGGYRPLQTLLERCDVLCLHTPLTRTGHHATHHLLDRERLEGLRPGTWLINAGRGAVIDNRALCEVLEERADLRVVLDVWEQEPGFDAQLARRVTWGTPHIAGHSVEGKARGTEMIYQALCRHLGVPAEQSLEGLLSPPPVRQVEAGRDSDSLPRHLVNLCYDLRDDDARLRRIAQLPDAKRGAAFDQLRRSYPERREFSTLRVGGLDPAGDTARTIRALGFSVVP